MLKVGGPQVTLEGECSIRNKARIVRRKGILEEDRKLRRRDEDLGLEVWRTEIEALAGGERSLVEVDDRNRVRSTQLRAASGTHAMPIRGPRLLRSG